MFYIIILTTLLFISINTVLLYKYKKKYSKEDYYKIIRWHNILIFLSGFVTFAQLISDVFSSEISFLANIVFITVIGTLGYNVYDIYTRYQLYKEWERETQRLPLISKAIYTLLNLIMAILIFIIIYF